VPQTNPQHQTGAKESLLDRAADLLKPQPQPPPRPHAPAVNRGAWEQSVDQAHAVPGVTVREVGLSVFGETRSLRERPASNESIDIARQKVAHAIINGKELAHKTGNKPPAVHDPVKPPDKVLRNAEERAAYDSSLRAAREAFLSGHDPTHGATNFRLHQTADRSNWKFKGGTSQGLAISTQSGPYNNSYLAGDVPSHVTWIDTYLPDKDAKKAHKK